MTSIPFVAYAKFIPERGTGKRFEIVRSREKFARLVYQTLASDSTIILARPGGGVVDPLQDEQLSTVDWGTAFKPDFGSQPDMLMIVGFYNVDRQNTPPYPNETIFHANEVVTGPAVGAPGYANLNPTNGSEAKALKAKIETAGVQVIKLDLEGIKWGQGGYHFPL